MFQTYRLHIFTKNQKELGGIFIILSSFKMLWVIFQDALAGMPREASFGVGRCLSLLFQGFCSVWQRRLPSSVVERTESPQRHKRALGCFFLKLTCIAIIFLIIG